MTKAKLNAIVANAASRAALELRYWPKVDVAGPDECWLWKAKAAHPYGYGRMTAGRGVNLKSHQIAFALFHGSVPEGVMVCHSCDRPACCNAQHLFLGTQTDNMRDAKAKGRISPTPHSFGEAHHATKFSAETARKIAKDTRAARVVASEYGISSMTVYRLRHGQTWKKLT